MTNEAFDNLLNNIMFATKLTQEEIAKSVGYNEGYISQMKSRGNISKKFFSLLESKYKDSLQKAKSDDVEKRIENNTHQHPSDAKLIAHLEKSLADKDAEIMRLREELKLIKDIQLSLDEAKKTQLRISAMNSAFHEKHLELLADKKDQNPKKLLQIVHRNATQKWTAAEKMGNLPGIDI